LHQLHGFQKNQFHEYPNLGMFYPSSTFAPTSAHILIVHFEQATLDNRIISILIHHQPTTAHV
jgi:hypothetical protein